jgi:transposase
MVDRDENAAVNILNAGLRFSLLGVAGEARKRNPEDQKEQVIHRVDATQLSLHQPKT